ncbi:unnamed protein product [Rotaria magnacalcarata]|uniref:Uncharacterized protein n=2 Tax=Rotaria magnacalcarata TaxID=392030 RepID=A0A816LJA1_9BILA|nr:unnamed protein product [Rotaria magnacalcarata]CAF2245549.1 unnamed protein product [Rotaria magnacalcarata]CAF4123951.1 unnamed protein product [Rotaria magnacalcarata]
MLKTLPTLLVFTIFIKCIDSKEPIRSYVAIKNKTTTKGFIHEIAICDSQEKKVLYRLKTSTSDIDTIILVDQQTKNIVANLEGIWVDGTFNVTFSIYDTKLNKWTDGTIKRIARVADDDYAIKYNNHHLNTDRRWYSKKVKLYYTTNKEYLARFRIRYRWFNWSPIKYDIQIYSNKVPDAVYFFLLTIMEHRGLSEE